MTGYLHLVNMFYHTLYSAGNSMRLHFHMVISVILVLQTSSGTYVSFQLQYYFLVYILLLYCKKVLLLLFLHTAVF